MVVHILLQEFGQELSIVKSQCGCKGTLNTEIGMNNLSKHNKLLNLSCPTNGKLNTNCQFQQIVGEHKY